MKCKIQISCFIAYITEERIKSVCISDPRGAAHSPADYCRVTRNTHQGADDLCKTKLNSCTFIFRCLAKIKLTSYRCLFLVSNLYLLLHKHTITLLGGYKTNMARQKLQCHMARVFLHDAELWLRSRLSTVIRNYFGDIRYKTQNNVYSPLHHRWIIS